MTTLWTSLLTGHVSSFYTRLFKIRDPIKKLPVFAQRQVMLVCDQCREVSAAYPKSVLSLGHL